jgi:hypothetical protein
MQLFFQADIRGSSDLAEAKELPCGWLSLGDPC